MYFRIRQKNNYHISYDFYRFYVYIYFELYFKYKIIYMNLNTNYDFDITNIKFIIK